MYQYNKYFKLIYPRQLIFQNNLHLDNFNKYFKPSTISRPWHIKANHYWKATFKNNRMIEATNIWRQQIFRTINYFEATNVFGERTYQGNFYFETTDYIEATTIVGPNNRSNQYLKLTNNLDHLYFEATNIFLATYNGNLNFARQLKMSSQSLFQGIKIFKGNCHFEATNISMQPLFRDNHILTHKYFRTYNFNFETTNTLRQQIFQENYPFEITNV